MTQLHPILYWYQNKEFAFIKINQMDIKNEKIKIDDKIVLSF